MMGPQTYAKQQNRPETLVTDNMPLVRRLAWHFHGRVGHFVEIEDILQADYRRLVDASQRYSTREGVGFSAYAAIRIRGSIIYFLRCNSNLCRATISMQQKVKQTILVLESEVKRNAEPKEIADRLKVSISG